MLDDTRRESERVIAAGGLIYMFSSRNLNDSHISRPAPYTWPTLSEAKLVSAKRLLVETIFESL